MKNRDTPSLASLEASVPDELAEPMWEAVERRITARRPAHHSWLVPSLVAASVTLLATSLLSILALGATREREAALLDDLRRQEVQIAALAAAPAPAPVGRTRNAAIRAEWVRSLDGRRSVTVDEFVRILADLPPRTVLLDEARVRAIVETRLVPSAWRRALDEIQIDGPLRAEDLLAALRRMDLPPGTTVPAARLLDVLG